MRDPCGQGLGLAQVRGGEGGCCPELPKSRPAPPSPGDTAPAPEPLRTPLLGDAGPAGAPGPCRLLSSIRLCRSAGAHAWSLSNVLSISRGHAVGTQEITAELNDPWIVVQRETLLVKGHPLPVSTRDILFFFSLQVRILLIFSTTQIKQQKVRARWG